MLSREAPYINARNLCAVLKAMDAQEEVAIKKEIEKDVDAHQKKALALSTSMALASLGAAIFCPVGVVTVFMVGGTFATMGALVVGDVELVQKGDFSKSARYNTNCKK